MLISRTMLKMIEYFKKLWSKHYHIRRYIFDQEFDIRSVEISQLFQKNLNIFREISISFSFRPFLGYSGFRSNQKTTDADLISSASALTDLLRTGTRDLVSGAQPQAELPSRRNCRSIQRNRLLLPELWEVVGERGLFLVRSLAVGHQETFYFWDRIGFQIAQIKFVIFSQFLDVSRLL